MTQAPALSQGSDALCACTGKDGRIDTKPHGHGDVHTLLHQHGCVDAWSAAGLVRTAGEGRVRAGSVGVP